MKAFTAFCTAMIYEDEGLDVRFKELWKAYTNWWDTVGSVAFPTEKKMRLHEFTEAVNAQYGTPEDGITYKGWALGKLGSQPNKPWWLR
jgi:hypothetical protein